MKKPGGSVLKEPFMPFSVFFVHENVGEAMAIQNPFKNAVESLP